MPEIVGTFSRAKLWDECANCSIDAGNISRRTPAEEGLEFTVRQLDRVEVGRVLWQITKARPGFIDRFANAGPEMDSAVVHRDDVVTLERRYQAQLK